jgi:hypothetical protein
MRHVRNAVLNLKRQDAGVVLNEGIGSMESTGIAISYYPNEFEKRIETFRKNFANMRELLKEQKTDEQRTEDFLNIAK